VKRAALWLVVLAAGCSLAGDDKTIDEARLDELVLQPGDLDPSLRLTQIRNLGGRSVTEVWYRRTHASRGPGPLALESTTQLFASDDAADESLDAARESLKQKRNWQPIDEPGLGDESFAATVLQGGVRHYDVVWREANATAVLSVEAMADELPLADVLALARRQQDRIERAAA
jgi:hypothetical protein